MTKIPKDRLFVQVPYEDLLDKLWLISLFKINCEIYVKPKLIDACRDTDLNRIVTTFDKNKILRTAHAPIYDPYKEGFDIFRTSYSSTSKFCKRLGIGIIVMHVEYDSKRSPSIEGWLKENIEIWKRVADSARKDNITVLVENHNESSAKPILRIIDEIGSEYLKACFDVGHFNAFGTKDIISYLGDYPKDSIKEIHLSDNLGDGDTHLALGKGNIDFLKFFNAVSEIPIDPIYTIEAKDVWGVMSGMSYLRKINKI